MFQDKIPPTVSDFPMAPNDMKAAMTAYTEGLMRGLQVCFPCCVYSYDRVSHTAMVMPLVKRACFNGEWEYIRRSPFKTTVRSIQAGGYAIDLPLYVGDTGWVFASDRDTTLLKEEGRLTASVLEKDRAVLSVENSYQQNPNTTAKHSFTHGFFLPDNWGPWEFSRIKDGQGVPLSGALYIGSSVDTAEPDGDGAQSGTAYEKKTTSSLVLNRSGGAYLLSSTETKKAKNDDDGKGGNADAARLKRSSKVAVEGDRVELAVRDATEDTPIDTTFSIGTESGIVVRQDNPKDKIHFLTEVNGDKLTMRLLDVKNMKTVNIAFESGQLHLYTTDEINVSSEKDINVKAAGNAYVSANDARVVVADNASVAARTVSASAEESVNIASAHEINVTAADRINLVTGSDVTVLAKKPGATIKVGTMSKDSSIEVSSTGENANISLSANKASISIGAKKSVDISAENISVSGKLSVSGESTFSGETKVNGRPLSYDGDHSHWV